MNAAAQSAKRKKNEANAADAEGSADAAEPDAADPHAPARRGQRRGRSAEVSSQSGLPPAKHARRAGGGIATDAATARGGPKVKAGPQSAKRKKNSARTQLLKKYQKFRWSEPPQEMARQTTEPQAPHVDVGDTPGYAIVIAFNERQAFDVWPASAAGIALLRELLFPLYDRAREYYESEIYHDWAAWNAGRSMEDGMMEYWSFIVHRLFLTHEVPLLWRRERLWLEPGHGLAVNNHILHAGADHDGNAIYRMHFYMTDSTNALARDISAPPVEDELFDFRTDRKWFPIARYLDLEASRRVDMIPRHCKCLLRFAYSAVCFGV
jgi:hypothetical protein